MKLTAFPILLALASTAVVMSCHSVASHESATQIVHGKRSSSPIPEQQDPGPTPPSESSTVESDPREWSSVGALRGDLRISEVAALVEVQDATLVDGTDMAACQSNTGFGYCSYRLMAAVKKSYKGPSSSGTLTYYEVAETFYPQKGFLGEKIVFLVHERNETNELVAIENSTRSAEQAMIRKMDRVMDVDSAVDDSDLSEPYSLGALRKEFDRADAVILADVIEFKNSTDSYETSSQLTARVLDVLKGSLAAGKRVVYEDDLFYRRLGRNDLGKQVLFLERRGFSKKTPYRRVPYTVSGIRHDILAKLRMIAAPE